MPDSACGTHQCRVIVLFSAALAWAVLQSLRAHDNVLFLTESSELSFPNYFGSKPLLKHNLNSSFITQGDAIFFNAFVPPLGVGAGPENALRIIHQQLAQRNISVMKHVPVYYTLIGESNISSDKICFHDCHLLRQVPRGSEELTLESLFDYCRQNPLVRVTYIHDKGSFHKRRTNDIRRAYTTKSVFSNACANMPITMCNICSLDFAVLPTHHAPANMWTANCSYIQTLIPPLEFEAKMREMYASLEKCNHDSNTNSTSCHVIKPDMKWADNHLGLGRHAMEVWAYSSPHVQPCSTMKEEYMKKPSLEEWTPTILQMPKNEKIRGIGPKTDYPWFKKQGRLYQYNYLYGEEPPKDSWFWKTYQYFY